MSKFLRGIALAAAVAVTCPVAGVFAQSGGDKQVLDLWRPGDAGQRLRIRGRVVGDAGEPIEGAQISLWQADGNGSYQAERYRANFASGKDGVYGFGSVLPGQYYGLKHIHMVVRHAGYQDLETRILFKGDPYLDQGFDASRAIVLEEASVNGETVLLGEFNITLRR